MSRIPALGLLLLSAATQATAAEHCEARSSATITPLVELYTSEGCSSCPPADRWFSKQIPDSQGNWLAFHVDYWDDIGWPDRFASHDYTLRQRARVLLSGGKDVIFTPQVMVGADVQAPWQSSGRFERALKDASQPAPVALALQAQPQGKAWDVRLGVAHIAGSASIPAEVWLAQYIDGQVSHVRAGENRGVTLHHDRVVRKLYGPWKLGAESLSQSVVVTPQVGSWGMTAFVQDGSGKILQSLSLPAAATCAPTGTASL
ncbi:MAG: DUF1223 domain-containing protein [Luteimonas sp.]